MKHTPGPWVKSPSSGFIRQTLHGWNIVEVNKNVDNWQADARLIAKAPEMYELLSLYVSRRADSSPTYDRAAEELLKEIDNE